MGGSSRAPFDQKSRGESQTPGDRRGTVVDLHHLGLPGCLLWATYLVAGGLFLLAARGSVYRLLVPRLSTLVSTPRSSLLPVPGIRGPILPTSSFGLASASHQLAV